MNTILKYLWNVHGIVIVLVLLLLSVLPEYSFPTLIPQAVSFKSWIILFSDTELFPSVYNSVVISSTVAIVSTVCGIFFSRLVRNPEQQRVRIVALFPFAVPSIVLAVGLYILSLRLYVEGTVIGVILAQLTIAVPFATVLCAGMWTRTVRQTELAARMLGAPFILVFRKVTLPIIWQSALYCFLQVALVSWFDFGISYVVGAGFVKTLPIVAMQYMMESSMSLAAVCISVLMVPAIVVVCVGIKLGLIRLFSIQVYHDA